MADTPEEAASECHLADKLGMDSSPASVKTTDCDSSRPSTRTSGSEESDPKLLSKSSTVLSMAKEEVSFRFRRGMAILTIRQADTLKAAKEVRQAISEFVVRRSDADVLVIELFDSCALGALDEGLDCKEEYLIAEAFREAAADIGRHMLPVVGLVDGAVSSVLTLFLAAADVVVATPYTQFTAQQTRTIDVERAKTLGMVTRILDAKYMLMECARMCKDLPKRTPEIVQEGKRKQQLLQRFLEGSETEQDAIAN